MQKTLTPKVYHNPSHPYTHARTHIILRTPWNGKLYATKAVRNCGCGSFGTERGGAQTYVNVRTHSAR